ncbi:hypothetical protein BpHYR1_030542, partial [Brachionus plicatilis]
FSSSPLRPYSSSNNFSRRQSTVRTTSGRNPPSLHRLNDDLPIETDNNSVNISLLNLESEQNFEIKDRKEYGKFNYFSYFERYMNRIAKRKIPSFLLPRPPSELADKPEPTLYELLDDSEQFEVWNQFYVEEALPFRIRSNSTGHDRKLVRSEIGLKRRHSIECFKEKYISRKLIIAKDSSFKDKQKNSDLNSMKSLLTEHDYDKFNHGTMEIKSPEIYSLGSVQLKKKSLKFNLQNASLSHMIENQEPIKKKYLHVESKLAKYLSQNRERHPNNSFTNTSRSKSAIQHHYISTNEMDSYKKPKSAHLRLSKHLEAKIREDLHRNRGPIYYGELRKENLNMHNSRTKLEQKDKFLYIFEWLGKMKDGECGHFFKNPFKSNVRVNTDNELRNKDRSDECKVESIFWDKKRKIDPFDNPKNHSVRERLPKRLNSAFVLNGFYETMEKQTLASKKNYLNCIQLNKKILLNKMSDSTTEGYSNTEEEVLKKQSHVKQKLAREKKMNDVLLTRMKLDLFIL